MLATYDWGEAFVALNVVTKPAIEAALLRQLAQAGRPHGDTLLGLLADAQLRDADRSRRWTKALVDFASARNGNAAVLAGWTAKWAPLAERALAAYCEALPDRPEAAAVAIGETRAFRQSLGLPA
jgi:toluene monooxygenase system protein E